MSELVEEADKGEKISGSGLWRPCHQKQRIMAKFDPPCVCLRIGFGIGVCMGGGAKSIMYIISKNIHVENDYIREAID